ncbi:Hypothetical protein A7982_03465 [Minicystis rosea]|nr:Hypothetical protein A7982_03465 [Minicystis rosea]
MDPDPGSHSSEPALTPRWLWIAFATIALAIPILGLCCETMR